MLVDGKPGRFKDDLLFFVHGELKEKILGKAPGVLLCLFKKLGGGDAAEGGKIPIQNHGLVPKGDKQMV